MIRSYVLDGQGHITNPHTAGEIRKGLLEPTSRLWVDFESPSDDEIEMLDDVFAFHPLAIEDVMHESQTPKVELYDQSTPEMTSGYAFVVIHGVHIHHPSPEEEEDLPEVRTKELDIFFGKNFLVTVHREPLQSLREVHERVALNPRQVLAGGIDMQLHQVLDKLVDRYKPLLEEIEDDLDQLEEAVLEHAEQPHLAEIARHKRDLVALRRVIIPQRDLLAQFSRGDVPFVAKSSRPYFRDVQDHLAQAADRVEVYRDMTNGIRDIYLSQMNANLNKIMKTLTIISVIALPLTVVTSFYGMNFEHLPGIHTPWAFWVAVCGMLGLAVLALAAFRWKRWL